VHAAPFETHLLYELILQIPFVLAQSEFVLQGALFEEHVPADGDPAEGIFFGDFLTTLGFSKALFHALQYFATSGGRGLGAYEAIALAQ